MDCVQTQKKPSLKYVYGNFDCGKIIMIMHVCFLWIVDQSLEYYCIRSNPKSEEAYVHVYVYMCTMT